MPTYYFDATPWAVPVAVAGAVLGLGFALYARRRWDAPLIVAWLYAVTLVGFLGVTTTPSADPGAIGEGQPFFLSLQPSLPTVDSLRSINETSMNVFLALPVGFSVVLMALLVRWWFGFGLAVPLLGELFQGLVPDWGRIGFWLPDTMANYVGVAGGVLLALPLGWFLRNRA